MNRTKVENYAPVARQECIAAVTNRAARIGLTKNEIEPITVKGDVALIGGNAFPRVVAEKRRKLEEQIKRLGFEQVIEAIAYTWFNRFVAIRYMELHGYIDHGYRVLSHRQTGHAPEILENAERIDLAALDKQKVIELKLDGTKEAELYRLLLVAQCNALHEAMPFLFERINDETELLLPDNLLHSDSIIRKLVNEIDESDWQEIEIIGWIYQFYISEKKDKIIGKVVKSEDIPAATQLFTPNWIVKYLVQNSLGRQWLATYPASPLRQKMEYYLEPAKQTPEVMAQLKEITPTSLNPEELKLLDPACGSGHILVEGYNLLKDIYLERGYRLPDIPKLILNKNLFGLEIDDRAAQLASFAMMMKARADDRRIFESDVRPNIACIQEAKSVDIERVIQAVTGDFKTQEIKLTPGEFDFMADINAPLFAQQKPSVKITDDPLGADIRLLLNLFENGKTFGSLIRVPEGLKARLPDTDKRLWEIEAQGGLISGEAVAYVQQFVRQASILADTYDAVVANPPYMGGKYLNPLLKCFAKDNYPDSKSDLFAMFIARGLDFTRNNCYMAMITMQSWMFLSSFEETRGVLLETKNILSMAHLGARAFDSIGGEVVSTTAFVVMNVHSPAYRGSYLRLVDGDSEAEKSAKIRIVANNPETPHSFVFIAAVNDFKKIPGWPVTYWVSERIYNSFTGKCIGDYLDVCAGLTTGNTDKFLRYWQEIAWDKISFNTQEIPDDIAYVPYNKGGVYRKWYGNLEYVLSYSRKSLERMKEQVGHRPDGISKFFKESITWAKITSSTFSTRFSTDQTAFDATSSSAFGERRDLIKAALILNSKLGNLFLNILNSTMVYLPRDVKHMPVVESLWNSYSGFDKAFSGLFAGSRKDWDSYETSYDFSDLPLLRQPYRCQSLEKGYEKLASDWKEATLEMQTLEEENNRIFIEAYGLQDELKPDVPLEDITLTCNPRYRYGGNKSEEELQALQRADTAKEFLSYSVGCMMGRYSLDKKGMVYANSGNDGFDSSQYKTFPADQDGIVPVSDMDWFKDDATNRLVEIIEKVWGEDQLDENLRFVAVNLYTDANEQPVDTIRRYFSTGFFKEHLKTYKKRPIYWLFSSGKQRAFQCLVYLHRYNESTLSRMRTEYVIPLQGKINARIEHLAEEIAAATPAQGRRLEKERAQLTKHRLELLAFDELLRHYADQRIKLDLDDGVRVNYGKFGNLLAEVDKVTGGGEE